MESNIEYCLSVDTYNETIDTRFWGSSKSKIKLKLNTESKSVDLTKEVESESTLNDLSVYLTPFEYNSSDKVLSPLFINIDYVDLRCDFRAAVSIFEHDIFHFLHDKKEDLKRHLFFAGMGEDAKYEKFYSYADPENTDCDTSIKSFLQPPDEDLDTLTIKETDENGVETTKEYKIILSLEGSSGYIVSMPVDLFIMPQSPQRNPPSYLQSSCAYDAMSGEIIFHINGSYLSGSFFNTETKTRTWAAFKQEDYDAFIKNHQISFYLIDLG